MVDKKKQIIYLIRRSFHGIFGNGMSSSNHLFDESRGRTNWLLAIDCMLEQISFKMKLILIGVEINFLGNFFFIRIENPPLWNITKKISTNKIINFFWRKSSWDQKIIIHEQKPNAYISDGKQIFAIAFQHMKFNFHKYKCRL